MKLILAIVLLSFSFSGHSYYFSVAHVVCPENSSEGTCTWSHQVCTSKNSKGTCFSNKYWSGTIPQTGYVDKKISDTEAKIETVKTTLVESINNLGTELKTGIVIELIKSDPEFRKIIEDIVDSKMKAKSKGDDVASNND